MLDLACGSGRHSRLLAEKNHPVLAVDRNSLALAGLAGVKGIETRLLELEGEDWSLAGETFAGIVVTNYLWRPRFADLLALLAPGGVLIYETFAAGNETVGRPARPDFLLRPGELLQACADLHTVAYENGFLDTPERFVLRIVAVRKRPSADALPARFALDAAG